MTLRLILLMATGAFFVVPQTAAAATVVPSGDQQIQYFAAENQAIVVPDQRIVTRDLSSPLSYHYAGESSFSTATNVQGIPSVGVSASTSRYGAGNTVYARSALGYFILISGPNTAQNIPIMFDYRLQVSASGSSYESVNEGATAIATLSLQEYSDNPETTSNSFIGYPFGRTIYVQNRYGDPQITNLEESTTSRVVIGNNHYLAAIIAAEVSVQDGGVASAFADPYFYIDPDFAAQNSGYSLSFSPFVGNDPIASGVPEPATWGMLILGFGVVGAAMRRRRSKVTTSVSFA